MPACAPVIDGLLPCNTLLHLVDTPDVHADDLAVVHHQRRTTVTGKSRAVVQDVSILMRVPKTGRTNMQCMDNILNSMYQLLWLSGGPEKHRETRRLGRK